MDNYLLHYGTPHDGLTPHSGRFPFGSGEDPFQHDTSDDIYSKYKKLKKDGLSDNEIASQLGLSINEFRAYQKTQEEKHRQTGWTKPRLHKKKDKRTRRDERGER